jgi:hypothetical protein
MPVVPETYDVYFGLSLAMPGLPLGYNIRYYWRIDATNEYGTTTGDTWYFNSIVFYPPVPSYSPPNMMATQRTLILCANNKVFYET